MEEPDEKTAAAVEWYRDASPEQRETFLYAVHSYAVSDTTWYIHPRSSE